MRRLVLTLAALAALAQTAPAAAQDGSETSEKRTVEGAQKFLVEFYATQPNQTVYSGARPIASGWEFVGASDPGRVGVEATLVEIHMLESCKTALTFRDLRKYTAGYPVPQTLPNAPATIAGTIDWSRVTSVTVLPRREYNPVTKAVEQMGWQVSSSGSGFLFYHPTEEMANRVAFAMNFLREQCGFKTDTGF